MMSQLAHQHILLGRAACRKCASEGIGRQGAMLNQRDCLQNEPRPQGISRARIAMFFCAVVSALMPFSPMPLRVHSSENSHTARNCKRAVHHLGRTSATPREPNAALLRDAFLRRSARDAQEVLNLCKYAATGIFCLSFRPAVSTTI